MKDFFTFLIAIVLFSLCLVEKEARKSAVLSKIEDESFVSADQPSTKLPKAEQNYPMLTVDAGNKMIADNSSTISNFSAGVASDSVQVSFSEESEKIY